MFDTNIVANNIKAARTKANMTQMSLADEMGVSYQAVSNWERGNSMPDISRLQELCRILDISFEELVGEKSRQTDNIEKLMSDEESEITLDDLVPIAPLIKPDKIEKKVDDLIKNENDISFSTLIGLAPFMDKVTLDKLAHKLSHVDIGKLCALAPFLSKETLNGIVEKTMKEENFNNKNVAGLAPFLSKETIKKLVEYMLTHGQEKRIIELAPFMGKEILSSIVGNTSYDFSSDNTDKSNNNKNTVPPCDSSNLELEDLDEDEVARLAFIALEKGNDLDQYLDYMNEDDVAVLAIKALESGQDVDIFLDYMDEDDVAILAIKALDSGQNVDIYLDYMDEDDVAQLASKSLKNGKDIEIFLDYLDDDAIKDLLRQSLKK